MGVGKFPGMGSVVGQFPIGGLFRSLLQAAAAHRRMELVASDYYRETVVKKEFWPERKSLP